MPKLRLKRTLEEEAAYQWRKKQKREAKSKHRRHSRDDDHNSEYASHKHPRTTNDNWEWRDDGDQMAYGPQPSAAGPSSSRPLDPALDPDIHPCGPDYEAIRAELDERRFREKMCSAFQDDERLDSIEARFNDFAHVPDRWRTTRFGKAKVMEGGTGRVYDDSRDDSDSISNLDPRYMDDEEYAEWIRVGMYRRTHAKEHAEQQRRESLKTARRAQEKALKLETERLEKAAQEAARRKKQEKEIQRWNCAREWYDKRWKDLLAIREVEDRSDGEWGAEGGFRFVDIPWPVLVGSGPHKGGTDRRGDTGSSTVSLDDLTAEAISKFLLSTSTDSSSDLGDQEKKERKEKLRETILRFHPDKFEGRIMKRVKEGERSKVREAIGQVVRVLNTLMGE